MSGRVRTKYTTCIRCGFVQSHYRHKPDDLCPDCKEVEPGWPDVLGLPEEDLELEDA